MQNVLMQLLSPGTGYSECIAMTRMYGVLKLGRGKIDVCLRNHSIKDISLPKWIVVGEIAATNILLALLVPKPTGHEAGKVEAAAGKRKSESQKEY